MKNTASSLSLLLLSSFSAYAMDRSSLESLAEIDKLAQKHTLAAQNLHSLCATSAMPTELPACLIEAAFDEAVACLEQCKDWLTREEIERLANNLETSYANLLATEPNSVVQALAQEDTAGEPMDRGNKKFIDVIVRNHLSVGWLTVGGSGTVGGNLAVHGNEVIDGNLIVKGDLIFSDTNLVLAGDLTVPGTATICNLNVTCSFNEAGPATINTTGSASTTIGTGGTGAVSIGNATGNTTIPAGNLAVTTGNISAANGNMLGKSLTITTTATICSLNITCGANVSNATFGNLVVTGTTTTGSLISLSLITGQTLSIANDATIGGNLTVNGTITAAGGLSGTFKDTQFAIVDATDATKKLQFDVQGNPGTTTTIITNPTSNRALTTTNYDGTLLAADSAGGQVFINSDVSLHGSNSGIQYSSTVSNRAQLRVNQYGANTGVPGLTSFKSRGLTIGSLAPVQAGDVIFRDSAIGVTDNLSIPLSAAISINVPAGGVPAGQGYIATEYELQLVSLDGPANGRRTVFKISSEGVPQLLETTSAGPHTTVPSGVVTLGAAGTVTVLNSKIPANARINLTVQPGPAPVGAVYVSAITANTSFTINSNAGAADAGLNVYYQIYIPLP